MRASKKPSFLLEGIKKAFDNLWLGFPKDEDFFRDRMVLKVYNWGECSKLPTFDGSTNFVSEYDGFELRLKLNGYGHKPFQTALILHAIIAFSKVSNESIQGNYPASNVSPERTVDPPNPNP